MKKTSVGLAGLTHPAIAADDVLIAGRNSNTSCWDSSTLKYSHSSKVLAFLTRANYATLDKCTVCFEHGSKPFFFFTFIAVAKTTWISSLFRADGCTHKPRGMMSSSNIYIPTLLLHRLFFSTPLLDTLWKRKKVTRITRANIYGSRPVCRSQAYIDEGSFWQCFKAAREKKID